jgi:hypothetical protein
MNVTSFGGSGIPPVYSQTLQPLSAPPSARGEAPPPLSGVNRVTPTFAPSGKETEYGKRFVIAREDKTNATQKYSPKENAAPFQQQLGRLVDRVV